MRFFTVERANSLLPLLAPILERLRSQNRDLDSKRSELRELLGTTRGNGGNKMVLEKENQASQLVEEMDHDVRRLMGLGCQVKDLDLGLVDFPSIYQGREVCLCWRLGEEWVSFWHEADAGFAGRRRVESAVEFRDGY